MKAQCVRREVRTEPIYVVPEYFGLHSGTLPGHPAPATAARLPCPPPPFGSGATDHFKSVLQTPGH
jgi:hypothetical protein